jgi:hypothetical protein
MIDRKSTHTTMLIFSAVVAAVIVMAFITTINRVDTRQARNEAMPGTVGLAHPHPPLDRAPERPVLN